MPNRQGSTPEITRHGRSRPWWRRAVGATAVVVCAGALASGVRYRLPVDVADEDRSILVRAAGDYRVTEGRISGFGYSRLRSASRSSDSTDNLSLISAAGTIQKRVASRPDGRNLAAYGVARLLMGDSPGAVEQLEEAAVLGDRSATVQSDLAAAYLARASALGTAEDRFKALAVAERARSIDSNRPEPLFNRALALESLGLSGAARAAWRDYIATDGSSDWSREAADRLSRLEDGSFNSAWQALQADYLAGRADPARLVSLAPGLARDFLERDLLPNWAKAELRHESEQGRALLARCEGLAKAINESGDAFFADELARIESLPPELRLAAARALDALNGARVSHELYQHESAVGVLEGVTRDLTSLGLPSALLARFYQGVTAYYLGRRPEAALALTDVATAAERRRYPHLAARALSAFGILTAGQAQYAKALDAYGAAQRSYAAARDRASVAYVDNLVAEVLHLCGLYKDSFRASFRALEQLSAFIDARRRQSVLFVAAAVSRKAGYPEAAAHFQRAFVDVAEASGVPTAAVEGRIGLALSLSEMGRSADAAREFETAERSIAGESRPARQQYLRGELLSARGPFEIAQRPTVAVEDLSGAIDALNKLGRKERIAQLYLELARAHRAMGRSTLAETATTRAVAALDDELNELLGRGLTMARLQQLWRLIGEAASDRFQHAGAAATFDLVERYKSALLRSDRPRSEAPSLDALKGSLPPRVGVLFFVPTDGSTLAWTVANGREYATRLPVSEARIRDLLAALERQLAANLDPIALDALHDALLAPLLTPTFKDVDVLAISAIGSAARMPWNALRHGRTRRHVVQDYTTWTFPGVDYLVSCSTAPATGRGVLVVSNPTADQPFLELPRLPETITEGREVSGIYSVHSRVTQLVGPLATRESFIREAATADVIHFGGHAVAVNEGDDAAGLVLAGSSYESALFRARDVRGLRLSQHPLVVLAACRTGEPPSSIGPGAPSLSGAFLAAGARATVSTLWPVEDVASRSLTVDFHRELESGASAPQALRTAITRRLQAETDNSPRTWGAYQVSGCLAASSARPFRETHR